MWAKEAGGLWGVCVYFFHVIGQKLEHFSASEIERRKKNVAFQPKSFLGPKVYLVMFLQGVL